MENIITKIKFEKKNRFEIINEICTKYNIRKTQFVLQFIAYLISNKPKILTTKFVSSIEYIIHNNSVKEDYLIQYLLGELESCEKLL